MPATQSAAPAAARHPTDGRSLKSDPRRPRCMRNDMTSVSRSGSIGGFVT